MGLDFASINISFIGSVGIPNRYGGFESFLEHCSQDFASAAHQVMVTCDASFYQDDLSPVFNGVERVFLNVRANGASSIIHDLLAFLKVYRKSTHIMVLGVSGGLWFPLFQLMCRLGGKRLGVNIDGVEWRRSKFSRTKQRILRLFDYLAQRFSDVVVYDNAGLARYVLPSARGRAVEISYSGDHVLRIAKVIREPCTALTVCRIEPENNLDMLIEGALKSNLVRYTIVGNWNSSEYGRSFRERFSSEPRLVLLDSIYDAQKLAVLRESCAMYLHGHSVGGTNPSLVEMLFYDCHIICLDVSFNRFTAGEAASYFADAQALAQCIDTAGGGDAEVRLEERQLLRSKYSSHSIASAYLAALVESDHA